MTERPSVSIVIVARIPPPALFAVTFVAGVLVQRALNPHRARAEAMGPIGLAIIAAGILVALWAVGLFARSHTTIVPHGHSSALVLRGPYRRSRNPMYVSLVLVYLGAALWANAWVALVLLVLPIVVLNGIIIPMEESQLRERFGDSYADYCRRVRRWL